MKPDPHADDGRVTDPIPEAPDAQIRAELERDILWVLESYAASDKTHIARQVAELFEYSGNLWVELEWCHHRNMPLWSRRARRMVGPDHNDGGEGV